MSAAPSQLAAGEPPLLPDVPPPVLPEGAGYRARRPTRDDADALLALCRSDETAAVGDSDTTLADVLQTLDQPRTSPQTTQWLVESVVDGASTPVVWTAFWELTDNPTVFVDAYRHPAHPEQLRAAAVRAYLEPVARLAAARGVPSLRLGAGAYRQDEAYAATLRSLGFDIRRVFSTLRIDLAGVPQQAPPPPPGVRLRAFRPDSADDWVAAHRIVDLSFSDHFEYQPHSLADWREQLATIPDPDYRRWLLAEVDEGDGRVAVGFLESNGAHLEAGGGWVRTLGVLAAYRGRGIGEALLRHAFARYAADGLSWAGLGVDTQNTTGALALYLRTGMHVHRQIDAYRLDVPAAS
jgi:ribosomal protein S18 acetylase RimI-like enzyme